ncbi:acyltransferase [Burkholderia pseudomultivorans]|uniref:acyltransferase family protein n=1 Tax=Burkholderia pseudomultivorans TaxID=1207504 RepID=UPI0001FD77B5|nr:acyltransferase [Burkholderia pseudomultivorans]AOI91971.1 acyltransferase [Burkholderia pseudomultivorans]EGD01405.1 acyltransferase 3 [Burkholderia sp. TJI49]KVC55321.1 acyltransferase [Burkholderia pseudomultivorans]
MTNRHQKYEVLDGLRGIAAISVMVMHFLQDLSVPVLQSAYLSVDIFFILSGFILTHSYGDKLHHALGIGQYLKMRLVRLYPMICIGLVIGAISLYAMKLDGAAAFSVGNFVSAVGENFLLLPYLGDMSVGSFVRTSAHGVPTLGNAGNFPLNPPEWSLFFEMFASLLFVAAIRFDRRSLLKAAYASLALFVVYGMMIGINEGKLTIIVNQGWRADNFVGGFFRVTYGFLIGVAIRKMLDSDGAPHAYWMSGRLIGSARALFVAFLLITLFPTSIKGLYPLAILVFVAPMLIFQGAKLRPGGALSARACSFVGWLSYPLYCVHYPVGRLVFTYLPNSEQHIVGAAALACCLSIAAAAVLAKCVEEPVRRYLMKRFAGAASRSAASPVRAA